METTVNKHAHATSATQKRATLPQGHANANLVGKEKHVRLMQMNVLRKTCFPVRQIRHVRTQMGRIFASARVDLRNQDLFVSV